MAKETDNGIKKRARKDGGRWQTTLVHMLQRQEQTQADLPVLKAQSGLQSDF